jgi:hypothetical protein
VLRPLSPQIFRDLVIRRAGREQVKQGAQTAIVLSLSVRLVSYSNRVPYIHQYTANVCPYAPRFVLLNHYIASCCHPNKYRVQQAHDFFHVPSVVSRSLVVGYLDIFKPCTITQAHLNNQTTMPP